MRKSENRFVIGREGLKFNLDGVSVSFLFRMSKVGKLPENVLLPKQRHTNKIEHYLSRESDAYDGLWAERGKGVALGVRTADCSPVAFWDDKIYGILHAGWRGVVGGIIERALELVSPQNAKFVIGPTIRACCYEVGDDVAQKFEKIKKEAISCSKNLKFQKKVVIINKEKGKFFVDIPYAIKLKLIAGGVEENNIFIFEGCTYCDNRFASFRRQGNTDDWQISFIVG